MSLEHGRKGSNYGKILDHLAQLGSRTDAESGPDGGAGVVIDELLKAIADESVHLPINLADMNRRLSRLGLPKIEVPGGVDERAGGIGDRIGEAAERAGDVIEGLGGLLKRGED